MYLKIEMVVLLTLNDWLGCKIYISDSLAYKEKGNSLHYGKCESKIKSSTAADICNIIIL